MLDFGFGLIADIPGPSILGSGPRAISLYIEIILTPDQSEGPIFSPVATPTIANDPILHSIFLTPSSHTDIMITSQSTRGVNEDT